MVITKGLFIESDVPFKIKQRGEYVELVKQMKVGDSVLVARPDSDKGSRSLALALYRKYGKRSNLRKLEGNYYRVWRVK